MNGFSCHTRILSGTDALSHLNTLHFQRVLVVTDAYFSKNGLAAQIAARIPGAAVQIFDEVTPDPELALVARGVAQITSFSPDCILALGGGSPMDCAKAMKYLSDTAAALIAIPTTSGTGSEVTTFSIITNGAVKLPLIDDALAPDLAILDPSLLAALPPNLIADAGFDILAHCLEAAVATGASAASQALSQAAFACAYENLPASYRGDPSVRLAIHEAACMAGIAFNSAGLGVCHALSHALGGRFHVPHGRLNAVLLPAVIEYNAETSLPDYAALAAKAGIAGSTPRLQLRNLLSGLRRLRAALGLPETLSQLGIAPEALRQEEDALCRAALEDRCIQTNPVAVDTQALRTLLKAVAG